MSGLIEIARSTPVGGTWVLNREKVMVDLSITDLAFEELQQRIVASLPGHWELSGTGCGMHKYLRLA
ncbi:MAG: hypothetical protein HC872_06295 [Gammaproteobacteria bacterium]|nr:hypothetical protein [Gammaproteobacteria bacterium]